MAYGFDRFIEVLEEVGVADVLLPFLLVFTITFAVLNKTKILGEGKKNINVIIALVLGLSVVIPHVTDTYPPGADVVDMMNVALPQVSLIAVAFVMLLILVNIYSADWMGTSISGWMALISAIAVLIIFGGTAGWWEGNWLYDLFGEDALSLFIMLIIFGLIIWFITREPGGTQEKDFMEGFKKIGNFFKGE